MCLLVKRSTPILVASLSHTQSRHATVQEVIRSAFSWPRRVDFATVLAFRVLSFSEFGGKQTLSPLWLTKHYFQIFGLLEDEDYCWSETPHRVIWTRMQG